VNRRGAGGAFNASVARGTCMVCSRCHHTMRCVDSRPTPEGARRLRIYRCTCGARVGSVEVPHDLKLVTRAISLSTKLRRERVLSPNESRKAPVASLAEFVDEQS